jgi:hypothetical protein
MKRTGTILDKIVADKKARLAGRKKQKPQARLEKELAGLDAAASGEPGFYDALKKDSPATLRHSRWTWAGPR